MPTANPNVLEIAWAEQNAGGAGASCGEGVEGCVRGRTGGEQPRAHLVDLMPAVLVPAAHGGVFMEQQFAAVGVPPDDRGVVQRGEAVAVFVIRGCSQLQKGLENENTKHGPHDPFCRK